MIVFISILFFKKLSINNFINNSLKSIFHQCNTDPAIHTNMIPYTKETKICTWKPTILQHQQLTLNRQDNITDSVSPVTFKIRRNPSCAKSSLNKDSVHISKNVSLLMAYMNWRKTPNKTQNIKQKNVVYLRVKDAVSLVKDATLFIRVILTDRRDLK